MCEVVRALGDGGVLKRDGQRGVVEGELLSTHEASDVIPRSVVDAKVICWVGSDDKRSGMPVRRVCDNG